MTMKLNVFATADGAARAAAALIASRVVTSPRIVLGLPTGRSVREVYAAGIAPYVHQRW